MANFSDTASMALFCDFENIALGVRDAQYEKFDIRPVLERLLAKGSIVVKKAYCDWDRYKGFKAAMHEANFELIEIPHVRQSGKNSADIRMVVDALDLCYTKAHVDTFVIISGDSDFSPLVSKLRENAKRVIGVGVKQSCSDLLIANCDEFIYYDDLVRERGGRRDNREAAPRRSPEDEKNRGEKLEARKNKAIELAVATFADLMADRGESERIWASVLKEVIKRRNPGFNETYFGFRSFGNLLEEAANRGLLGFGRDEKSGAYVTRVASLPTAVDATAEPVAVDLPETAKTEAPAGDAEPAVNPRRRNGRRSRGGKDRQMAVGEAMVAVEPVQVVAEVAPAVVEPVPVAVELVAAEPAAVAEGKARRGRRPRKAGEATEASAVPEAPLAVSAVVEEKPAKAKRPARARKAKASEKGED